MRAQRIKKVKTPSSMVLRTKLILPEIKGKVIDRHRLLRLIQDNEDKKIVLIIADAGYGKTTLISQWVRKSKCKSVFYGLSEEDSNFDLFWSHLIAGFERLNPDLLERVKGLIDSNKELKNDIGMLMGTLVNELQERCKSKYYVILDDYHTIAESSVVHEALRYFIENLPNKVHLVIASRVLPSFPSLIKWRSKQQVFELQREDLSFNSEEVKELISSAYKLNLSGVELERIEKYTEGWVTGIQLILQSSGLHRTAIKDTLNGFLEANQPLFEYFANEVLSYEPLPVRNFLIQSSVLETLTPQLCNAILGRKDSQFILEGLEHRHVFLFEVKEKEYKFHHLFRKFLNQHLLKQKGYEKLHDRAAKYYRKHRLYDLSIKHYLAAKEYRPAGAMILKSVHGDVAGRISGNIDAVRLQAYLSELPTGTLHELPALLVIKGTLVRDTGDHEKAKALYRDAEKTSRALKDMITCAHSQSEMALLHWLQGKHYDALAILNKALRTCPASGKKMRLHILNLLGLVWQDLSGLQKAKTFLSKARNQAERLNIFYDKIILESNIATIFLQEGEIKRAYHACKPLIAQLGEHYYYKVGVIYANAARAALDFGDIKWAESCLEQGWNICRQYEDQVSHGTMNHCFGIYYTQKQQWDIAHKHFEEARKVFQLLRWRRMESSVLRNIGVLQRLQGDLNKSLQSIAQAEDLLKDPVPQKTAHAAFLLADRALIEVDLGNYPAAAKTIAQCLQQARLHRWHLGQLYGFLVKALISIKGNRKKGLEKLVASIINITRQKGYHGILALELKHKPDLLAYMNKFAVAKAYIDKYQLYVALKQPRIFVNFFGGMRIEDGVHQQLVLEWPTEKTRSLFAFLVINRTRGLTRDEVLDALWSGLSKKKAHENLRTTSYRMRQAIGQAEIPGVEKELIFTFNRGQYLLFPNIIIESDLDEFYRLVKIADILPSEDDKKNALKQAIEISHEPFLTDIYDQWIDDQRLALREQKLAALHRIIKIASNQNDHLECAKYCKQYLLLEPLSEEIACIYMASLKDLGRRSEIKNVYQTLEKALRDELKSDPAPETQQFYHALTK